MQRFIPRLILLLFVAFSAQASTNPRNVEAGAPLPADPVIQYRSLPNGMRYWVRPHARPAGKVTLWLRVGSGSLNEDQDQRGAAHFLEHMAFNGSTHFPAGTLIKRFEAIGLTFGAHQNANTGFIDTTYKLTIPNTPEALELALLNFADIASGLTLDPVEIDKERNILLEERRARDSAANRAFNKHLSALVPGSRFAERLPLGDEQVIRTISAKRLRDYYEKWYRPDNTALLVAGDVNVAMFEGLVRKHFSDWKAHANPSANAESGIEPYTVNRAAVFSEYGLIDSELDIARIEKPRTLLTTADYRDWIVDLLGRRMLNWRLREQVLEGKAVFTSAWVTTDNSFNAMLVESRAKGGATDWQHILRGLVLEIKRARVHGFSDEEFHQAIEVIRTGFEKDVADESNIQAARWVAWMDEAVEDGRRPMNARQELELVKRLLPTIKRAEVQQALVERFAHDAAKTLTLTLPRRGDIKPPTSEELLKLVADAEALPVEKPQFRKRPDQLLARDPRPAAITRQSVDPDLQVVSATLENGVRVHFRPMNYEKGQVSVRLTLAGGRLSETHENRGVSEVAALPFKVPATDTLSSVDIKRIMATKHVTVSGRDAAGGLELDITGHRKDLQEGFRLAYLLLTHAKIEEPAFQMWRRQAAERQENREGSVGAQLNQRVDALLTSNDPRFRTLSRADVERLTLKRSQEWLDGLLHHAPIEVAIVGDLTQEQALALAAQYLGSLPARQPIAGAYANLRQLAPWDGPQQSIIKVDTATPKAMVYVGWRGPDWQDMHDWHMMEIAGRILTSRLMDEIRERHGLVYSIRARSTSDTLYRGNGRFRVAFVVDPNRADEAAQMVEKLVAEFVRTGPTPAELATAREQASNSFRTGSGDPRFWLDILSDLEYMGSDLGWVKAYLENVTRYTGDQMVTVLRKYIRPERLVRVIGAPADAPIHSEPPRKSISRIN